MKKQLQQARNLADTQTRRTPTTFGQGVVAKEYAGTTAQASNAIVLENVRMVEEGEAKGHGVWMDDSFIKNVVELGNATGTGIKCRFDHMTHCMNSMGWLLGKYKDFQFHQGEDGKSYATANLHLLNAAKKSPHGDLTTYINELATEAPEFFGTSIVFRSGPSYYKTDKGVAVYSVYGGYDRVTDDPIINYTLTDGTPYDEKEHGIIDHDKEFETIKSLEGADLVDSPAATTSLFGSESVFDNVMLSLGKVFGVDIAGKRKSASIRRAFNEILNMSKKFDINAKTSAGVDIIIATDNDSIRIGDAVVLPDGSAAPDGEHAITEADNGQTGITITVSGGSVTRIDATPAPAEAAPMSEGEAASSQELSALSKAVNNLNAMFNSLSAEAKSLKEAQAKMNEKLLLLDSKPDKNPSDIVDRKLGTPKEDNGFVWLR